MCVRVEFGTCRGSRTHESKTQEPRGDGLDLVTPRHARECVWIRGVEAWQADSKPHIFGWAPRKREN